MEKKYVTKWKKIQSILLKEPKKKKKNSGCMTISIYYQAGCNKKLYTMDQIQKKKRWKAADNTMTHTGTNTHIQAHPYKHLYTIFGRMLRDMKQFTWSFCVCLCIYLFLCGYECVWRCVCMRVFVNNNNR